MAEFKFTNKLLKEAIADAEAVRQTAIENAKLSLEETFTPQIQAMISRRLRAEAEGMDDEEEEKDVEKQDAPEGEEKEAPKAAPFAGKTAQTAPKMETAKEVPHQDGEAESGEFADTSMIGSSDNKEPAPAAFDTAEDDTSGEAPTDSPDDWYDDWTESDFDLDEVIKELEADMKALEGGEEEEESGEEEAEGGEEEAKADEAYPDEEPEAGKMKPQVPPHTSKIGKDESQAADINKFVTEPSVPKMEGEEGEMEAPEMGHEAGQEEAGEDELDLESILKELEAEDEKHKQSSEKMASLEKELAEYRQAVKLLRGKLHEVNLLNAKLLYTNKIFRKEGLSTDQKVMVVENFDRASTVREVKMVYTVLVETLTSAARVVKTTKSGKKVVAEGLASKATPSTAPKKESTEVLAENSVAKRLQQLAGIIS
tara:strand:+ start:2468 stop:3748 length:1281 start_codon:yes stop_codon:yes gene_type:complete